MGGRQLQKLLKERESLLKVEEDEQDQNSPAAQSPLSSASSDDVGGTVFNPFSLLTGDEEHSEPEACEEEEEEDGEEELTVQGTHKAKKTKRKKKKASLAFKSTAEAGGSGEKEEEDLEKVFRELNIEMPVKCEDTATSSDSKRGALLQIQSKYLRAEEELKRLFGSDVTRETRSERELSNGDGFSGASRRIRRLAARGLIRQHELRDGILIHPRNTWPAFRIDDLKLTQTGTSPDGKAIMTYIGSQFYESVQAKFAECQASFNPRMLMGLLQAYPYHVDGLLTMADVYRSTGDGAYSDELIEKALYILERGWPRTFINSINTGPGIHVPYENHNKSFFRCLMRYIQILGKRGLHRSALEISKLMLSLNSHDPCGILFTIDYYALRCKKYDFLHQMSQQYDDGGIAIMPNIVYSVALARFYQELDAGQNGHANENRDISADNLLTKAIMIHPEVLVKLQKKLQEDVKVAISHSWEEVLQMDPFGSATAEALAENASLERIVDIFIERHHLLWKSSAVQDFMLRAAKRVAYAASDPSGVQRQNLPFGLAIDDWTSMRKQAFPASQENSYNHLHVHDFSDSVAALPPEEVQDALQQHPDPMDDLQPHEMEAILANAMQDGQIENLEDTGALAGFLRSLLPWVNAGQVPSNSDEDEEPSS
jgi:hypothetical protein